MALLCPVQSFMHHSPDHHLLSPALYQALTQLRGTLCLWSLTGETDPTRMSTHKSPTQRRNKGPAPMEGKEIRLRLSMQPERSEHLASEAHRGAG